MKGKNKINLIMQKRIVMNMRHKIFQTIKLKSNKKCLTIKINIKMKINQIKIMMKILIKNKIVLQKKFIMINNK